MLTIVNNQRKIGIELKTFEEFLESAASVVTETRGRDATIVLISDRKMRELNSGFRQKNQTTDVLSFPFEPDEFESDFLGDIAISLEQAARQSAENGLDLETEVKQLILHGILHLCGYDHETDNGEMNSRELELREKLNIAI